MWCLHWCDTRQPRGKANDFTCLTPHTEMQKWPHIVIYLLQCWGRPCGELAIREDRNTRKSTLNTFITNSINKHYKHKIWMFPWGKKRPKNSLPPSSFLWAPGQVRGKRKEVKEEDRGRRDEEERGWGKAGEHRQDLWGLQRCMKQMQNNFILPRPNVIPLSGLCIQLCN